MGDQRFANVTFVDNAARAPGQGGVHDWLGGGGIFNSRGRVALEGVAFLRCAALDHGGAVMNYMGQVTVRGDSSFVDCHAKQGGAMYTFMWGTIDVDGAAFRRCLSG